MVEGIGVALVIDGKEFDLTPFSEANGCSYSMSLPLNWNQCRRQNEAIDLANAFRDQYLNKRRI